MSMSTELKFSSNTAPTILDLNMPEQLDADPDFEFFDSNALDVVNSPSLFVDGMGLDNSSQLLSNLLSPKCPEQIEQSESLGNGCQSSLSISLSESSVGSYQDSSSDSSDYPRKSSSGSLTSALTPGDIMMGDDTDMVGDWNMLGGEENSNLKCLTDGYINPSAVNPTFLNGDTSFEQDFNFESSASSSSFEAGITGLESPKMTTIKTGTPIKNSTPAAHNFKVEATISVGKI